MKELFKDKKFRKAARDLIAKMDAFLSDYETKNRRVTVRQIYYRLVSENAVENSKASYNRVQTMIKDARLAGLLDWDVVEDRTRDLTKMATWANPAELMKQAARQYRTDLWKNQPYYCEVWVEKEALIGLIEEACSERRVPFFACRGYTSVSALREAGCSRLLQHIHKPAGVRIVYLGDHDPSGLDMVRDVKDRLDLFMGDDAQRVQIQHIGLSFEQVQKYNLPPNFAKKNDRRFEEYKKKHGDLSWELDALNDDILIDITQTAIDDGLDFSTWERDLRSEAADRASILSRWS